jgi:hypothetical protein
VVVLKLQYGNKIPASFVWLSNGLALLISIASALMIYDAFRSWHGYRQKLADEANRGACRIIIPPPQWHPSSVWYMFWVIGIACVMFMCANPLRGN